MTDEKRPSLREAARRGVEAKQPPAPTTPSAPPAEQAPRPAAPPRRVKPPVVGTEQVAARCGHAVSFELFEPKKDKFRDDRRKKLTNRDCTACRVKAQEERQSAEQEEARRRRAANPKPARQPAEAKGRLPHGSRYDASYDAAKGEWSGTLTIPAATPAGTSLLFSASASAVFRLLRRLDDLYRASAAETPDAGADVNRDEGGES